jgi:hypothetical protein
MKQDNQDSIQAKLKQLWGGGQVPDLTEEQTQWALVLWNKINNLKLREQKELDSKGLLT